MKSTICIGNQTAFTAPDPLEPFRFALENGFDAFEWFSDKKEYDNGGCSGWEEADFTAETREHLRLFGEQSGMRFSVHAPWQANPLNKDGVEHLEVSIDFAQDIGAELVNLHFCMDDGPAGFIRALRPIMSYAAEAGVKLTLENTPYTLPQQVNAVFAGLRELHDKTDHVGLCFDMGHANICSATHNDYIRYLDILDSSVPLFHIHMHENFGDEDSHLTIFTGPAGSDEGGVRALIDRLRKRTFVGSIILEQWPDPSELLSAAGEYLRELADLPVPERGELSLPDNIMMRPREELEKYRKKKPTRLGDEGKPPLMPDVPFEVKVEEEVPAEITEAEVSRNHGVLSTRCLEEIDQDFVNAVIATHSEHTSWRARLQWVRERIVEAKGGIAVEQLACLSIYLRFLGTGELICEEDGGHYRPCHHAEAALDIEEALANAKNADTRWLLRRITPWLPSFGEEFRRREPLTRIRDIAHRNDIPQELKSEIKHRLQNKLHRCAGPEDLSTSAELLGRITASGANYSADFVREFAIFHDELSEFFNATGLDNRLEALQAFASREVGERVHRFVHLKREEHDTEKEILALLEELTALRMEIAELLKVEEDPYRCQRARLADVGLDDYAFPLLSEAANLLETAEADVEIEDWDILVRLIVLTLKNVALSSIEPEECAAIEAELLAWGQGFSQEDRFSLLRAKATFDRARRLAEGYTDRINHLFPPYVASLGVALGVDKQSIEVFCEGDIRGNLIFQFSKLVELGLKTVRSELDLSPWEAVVPGVVLGKVRQVADLAMLEKEKGPIIALVDTVEGDEEVPAGVRGILLGHAVPHLSHLGVRARQTGVAFAASDLEDELHVFAELAGGFAELTVTPDEVSLKSMTEVKKEKDRKAATVMIPALISIPEPEMASVLKTLPIVEATISSCGGKATSAAKLLELAEISGGLFKAPPSMVLPFGCMELALQEANLTEHYNDCVQAIANGNAMEMDEELTYLQRMLRGLCISTAISVEIADFFGNETLLAVRSSANGEDLATMAGAGLYDSIVGVTSAEVTSAIGGVWASLWTRRAALSRQQAGICHKDIRMAVLIQKMVKPETCFILHTVDPVSQDKQIAFAELAPGLGEILASAGQPGSPYRLHANRETGEVEITALSNYSMGLIPDGENFGNVSWRRLSYADSKLSQSADSLNIIGQRLGKISAFLEEKLGVPQDVEGVINGADITLVQTRAEQGLG